MEYVIS